MKPKNVVPLTRTQLEQLTTPRLLKYLHKLHECELSPQLSDMNSAEITATTGHIVFKSSPEWRSQYNLVKSILAKRPHLEKDAE